MLRYTLIAFLCAIICCNATDLAIGRDTVIGALSAAHTAKELLNGNLTLAQIIYIYAAHDWKTQSTANLIEKIGNDYLMTPGIGGHKLHLRKLTWNKARKICLQEGGHLAVINSNSEEKILLRMLEENKITQAWLGVHDLYEEGDWNTIMDEPMEASGYSKWSLKIANLPDNHNGKQHCGILMKDGGMDDLDCISAQAFFCKINF